MRIVFEQFQCLLEKSTSRKSPRQKFLGDFEKKAAALPKNKPIIVICDVGRSALGAATRLRKLGFTEVVTLDGGLKAWLTAGLPVTANKTGA